MIELNGQCGSWWIYAIPERGVLGLAIVGFCRRPNDYNSLVYDVYWTRSGGLGNWTRYGATPEEIPMTICAESWISSWNKCKGRMPSRKAQQFAAELAERVLVMARLVTGGR